MNLTNVIKDVVSGIHQNERNKQFAAAKLQAFKEKPLPDSENLLEENLTFQIEKPTLNSKIGGVDSGFMGKSLAGMDITLVRSTGVVFKYKNSKVEKADYWPAIYHFPEPYFTNGALEKDESNCSKSLLRLREEINTAKNIIEKYSPEYCFLDGSIIPQYADKPRKNSRVESLYEKILNDFQSLYKTAEKNNCELIASVEDSRGSRFIEILKEELLSKEKILPQEKLDNLFDSSLLDYLLDIGERSFTFKYTKSISEHPILMDYDEKWSQSIHVFYLKPAAYDRPLRVEFLANGKNITQHTNKIAGIVYALSCMHREYAYPSILIEADLRSKLTQEEINIVFNKIMDKINKNVKIKLRRESRPF